jgi:hypothetical protein
MKHVNVRRYLHYSTVLTVLNCMKGRLTWGLAGNLETLPYTLLLTLDESGYPIVPVKRNPPSLLAHMVNSLVVLLPHAIRTRAAVQMTQP